jgi:putative ABC transport system substrate-binding protein
MRRREFIAILGATGLAQPFSARAQKAPVRIGFLAAGSATSVTAAAVTAEINQALRANGLIEGHDYILEQRYSAGHYEQFPDMARELAQNGVGVILVNTISAVRAAQQLIPPLPVVMLSINDPVGTGLVASLARPGGHTTGMATMNEDVAPKMLEFQQTIVPQAKVVAVLFNPVNPTNPPMVDNIRAQAYARGMTVLPVVLRTPEGLDAAFSTIASGKAEAIQLVADSSNLDLGDRIAAFAIEHRLPSFATWPALAELGTLLAYGPSRRKLFVKAAYYVKRILDGADPADLPVEQPIQIELWINIKTGKALGLEIPPTLLARADEVIE